MENLIEIRSLEKHIPIRGGAVKRKTSGVQTVHAVDGIDLDILHNETLALVGESGCGKSTLGKMLVGLSQPTKGQILFEGRDVTTLSTKEYRAFCRNRQIIFQDIGASLNPRKNTETILSMPFRVNEKSMREEQIRFKAAELLERVGLVPAEAYLERYPHEFSGGQRQRIGIARAIALRPKFIVADEPVSALDVSVRGQILNLMKDLKADLGLSYLFITHDLSVVRSVADRVAVMYLGKIVEIASADQFFARTLHPYAKAILSATPIADPELSKKRNLITLQGEPPSPVNIPAGCRFHVRCPYAAEICMMQSPCLHDAGDGHLVACHLYNDTLTGK